jgi:transposase
MYTGKFLTSDCLPIAQTEIKRKGEVMQTQTRRSFTPEKKQTILLEILKEQKTVSEVSEKYGVAPSQLYTWQNEAFSRLHQLFADGRKEKQSRDAEKERLRTQLKAKETFASELLEEYTKLKKSSGLSL